MDSISQQYTRLHQLPFHLFSICLETPCWSAMNQHCLIEATLSDQVKIDIITHGSEMIINLTETKMNWSSNSKHI